MFHTGWVVLVCDFWVTGPFHVSCKIYSCCVVYVSHYLLDVCRVCIDNPCFIADIGNFYVSSHFVSLARGSLILLIFSEKYSFILPSFFIFLFSVFSCILWEEYIFSIFLEVETADACLLAGNQTFSDSNAVHLSFQKMLPGVYSNFSFQWFIYKTIYILRHHSVFLLIFTPCPGEEWIHCQMCIMDNNYNKCRWRRETFMLEWSRKGSLRRWGLRWIFDLLM